MGLGFIKRFGLALGGFSLTVASFAGLAFAEAGQAVNWQLGFQESVTEIMDKNTELHNMVMIIITVITLFVMALLLYVMVKFNEKANPVPSKVTHSTSLEFAWTVIPILILLFISLPSWRLLYDQYTFPKADLTIKAIGNQWNWDYEYPDHEGISFTAIMLEDDELKPGQPRLLATDNPVVVPVNKVVHVLMTADPAGVIHNFTVPSFGIKADAVPGRVTRTWFKARKTGTYYGQCSELCGKDHAFMPIEVKVVTGEEYEKWLKWAKEEYASNDRIDDRKKHANSDDVPKKTADLAKE